MTDFLIKSPIEYIAVWPFFVFVFQSVRESVLFLGENILETSLLYTTICSTVSRFAIPFSHSASYLAPFGKNRVPLP